MLNQDGDIGKYNRANRSLHHFLETSLGFVASLPINFFLWPLPTFVLLCVYCAARMAHQSGYASGGWGSHAIGFFVDRLCSFIMIGLMIVAYLKMVL